MRTVTCPNGHALQVGPEHEGQRVQCPACGEIVGGKPKRVRPRRALSPFLVAFGVAAIVGGYVARRSIWPEEEPAVVPRTAAAVEEELPDWLTSDPVWENGDASPHLPGAVRVPPDWLRDAAPFDVDELFAPVPPGENAAPLYLAAFREFDPSAARCFPLAERPAIFERAAARKKRIDQLYRAWEDDPELLHPADADELLAELSEGFRLLAAAQARPGCVFESGLSSASWLPHAECARTVMRAALLQTGRALARRDADAMYADMEMLLRLCRDLCPRAGSICQLVSMSMQGEVLDLIARVLELPWIGPADCERLLALLSAHEAGLPNRFTIAHQTEYLMYRIEFEELVKLRNEQAARGEPPPAPRFDDLTIDPKAKGDVLLRQVTASLTLEEAQGQIAALDQFYFHFMLLWQFPYRACVSGMFVMTDELFAQADSALVRFPAATCEIMARDRSRADAAARRAVPAGLADVATAARRPAPHAG